jgi:hypothetical protein
MHFDGFYFRFMKVALVTGVSGQDGACLAKSLLEKGHAVFVPVLISLRPSGRTRVLGDLRGDLSAIHESQILGNAA